MDMKLRNEENGKLDKLNDYVSAYQKKIQAVKKNLKSNVKVKEKNESNYSSKKNEKSDQLIKNNGTDLKSPDNDEETVNEDESDTDSSETFLREENDERNPIKPTVASVTMWEERNISKIGRNNTYRNSCQRDYSEKRNDQRNYNRKNFIFRDQRLNRENDRNYNYKRDRYNNKSRFEDRNFYRSRNDDVFEFLQRSEV